MTTTRGQKVAAARRALGRDVTQEKLAKLLTRAGLKVNRGWVANVESDRTKQLFENEIEALAQVLQKPVDHFKNESTSDLEARVQALEEQLRHVKAAASPHPTKVGEVQQIAGGAVGVHFGGNLSFEMYQKLMLAAGSEGLDLEGNWQEAMLQKITDYFLKRHVRGKERTEPQGLKKGDND